MSRLFSTFSNTVSQGSGDHSNFLHDVVGESVSKIDRLVPTAIKHVSSEATSAAQNVPGVAGGVATGVVSRASGFIDQLSSEAISVAQKAADVATDVQRAGMVSSASGFIDQASSEAISAAQDHRPAGLVSTASGFIKHVSSDAISAAQGVATDIQPSGLVSTASGFIKQVSSDAISVTQKAPGVATDIQPGGLVSTASGFIKQVSSDAVSAAQGVATEVHPAGLVGQSVTKIDSLVPSVIKQVSSEAISASQKAAAVAEGVASDVQQGGVVSTASGFIKQVSSDAISAAQGVATELQPAGLVSTASGLIKHVSSDAISAAQGVAAKIQHPGAVKEEEEQGLKYLAFVQVIAIHMVSFFTKLYTYVKENSGPLKPVIEFIEGIVKSVFRLVFAKFRNVPFEILKYFDGKVGELVTKIESLLPPDIRQAISDIIWIVQKVIELAGGVDKEVEHTGVLGNSSGFLNQVSSGAFSAIQNVPGLGVAGDMAAQIQWAKDIIELIRRLKNLGATFINYYLYVLEKLGPLKPVVKFIAEIVVSVFQRFFQGMFKRIFELVLEKYFGVPPELLNFVDGTLGESANTIGNLVPSVIGQISSTSRVAQGVANLVQPAGVVGTASGFLNQVASNAISVTQKAPGVTTEVQPLGLVNTASGFFSQVASEAFSVSQNAPGVATQVQPTGLVNTASGFLNQVTSEALSIAQKAPGVVATDVQPLGLLSTTSGFIKQVSSEANSAGQNATGVATEVQPTVSTSTDKGLLKQIASEVVSTVEDMATEVGISTWLALNKLPLVPQVASVAVPTAACFTKKYNQIVVSGAEKGFKVASYLPLVPIEKIAKAYNEKKPTLVAL
ncbi:hypothetical protein DITRI_Ditri06bG0169200 [Diplodiscus trichospermus]